MESYNPINLLTIGFNTFSKKDSARLDEPKLGFKFITKEIVTRDNARQSQERYWPVVVQIDSQQMGMIYYFDIEWQGQGQGKLKLVQQKYQVNGLRVARATLMERLWFPKFTGSRTAV